MTLVLAALSLVGCGEPPPDVEPRPLPSVLLITVDTLRPDYLSGAGYDRPTTPFLDDLLADGVVFDRAYAPVPRTTQALASLLTGAYPHTTGVRRLTDTLTPSVTTMTELLRDHGYQTRAVVANHILSPARELRRGFAIYGSTDHAIEASVVTETAIELLGGLDARRPFFLWCHYLDPHVPYRPPPTIAAAFDPGYVGPFASSFGLQPQASELAPGERLGPRNVQRGQRIHRNELPADVVEHVRRLYAGEIRDVDDAIAALVAAVGERSGGVLTIFAADHGESLGEHDYYWDHGDYVYDVGARVPLAFVLPRDHPLRGAGRCAAEVSLVDVVPTLLDLVRLEPDRQMRQQLEGRSLVDCLRGRRLPPRAVFIESGHSFFPELVRRRVVNTVAGRFRAVVYDGWKLVWTPFQSPDREWELYHLTVDPGETHDLYRPAHPRVAGLKMLLSEWLDGASAAVATAPLSSEDEAALRSLGYLR